MKVLILTALVFVTAASPAIQSVRPISGREDLERNLVARALRSAPKDAELLGYWSEADGAITAEALLNSLASNASRVIGEVKGGFTCKDKTYGYYADVNNDCKVFHLCYNLHQVFPSLFDKGAFYMFSFFCPEFTIFTQDAMVCAFERSAVPCAVAEQLYHLNENFFKNETEIKKIVTTTTTDKP